MFSFLQYLRKTPGQRLAVAIGVALPLSFASPSSASPSQITERNQATVREAFENWVTGKGNVFDILSANVRWTIHGSGPVADTYYGIADFIQRGSAPLVSRLSSPLTPEVRHIWAQDDWVIIRFDACATTTSGSPYRNQFVWIFRMDNGSVVEAEAFLDLVAYQHVVDSNEPMPQ